MGSDVRWWHWTKLFPFIQLFWDDQQEQIIRRILTSTYRGNSDWGGEGAI